WYSVFAVVTPPGGAPSSPVGVGPAGLIVVDTRPPRLIAISSPPGTGRLNLSFRDDLSGMFAMSLLDVANYTVAAPGTPPFHPASAQLLPTGGLLTDTQGVVLTIAGVRKGHGARSIRITAAGVTDNAGNPLASTHRPATALAFGRAPSNVVVK